MTDRIFDVWEFKRSFRKVRLKGFQCVNMQNLQMLKYCDIFLIFAQNIACGYSLESLIEKFVETYM